MPPWSVGPQGSCVSTMLLEKKTDWWGGVVLTEVTLRFVKSVILWVEAGLQMKFLLTLKSWELKALWHWAVAEEEWYVTFAHDHRSPQSWWYPGWLLDTDEQRMWLESRALCLQRSWTIPQPMLTQNGGRAESKWSCGSKCVLSSLLLYPRTSLLHWHARCRACLCVLRTKETMQSQDATHTGCCNGMHGAEYAWVCLESRSYRSTQDAHSHSQEPQGQNCEVREPGRLLSDAVQAWGLNLDSQSHAHPWVQQLRVIPA